MESTQIFAGLLGCAAAASLLCLSAWYRNKASWRDKRISESLCRAIRAERI